MQYSDPVSLADLPNQTQASSQTLPYVTRTWAVSHMEKTVHTLNYTASTRKLLKQTI